MALRAATPLFLLSATACATGGGGTTEAARWQRHVQNVTITRDNWGIAHVKGKTDADAVFGAIYAQAEDDFNRIETNYLTSLGRLAEAEGEKAIWQDLRAKMYMQPEDLQARYAASPEWLKRLMVAWADGLNHYLSNHPEVKPRVITRFEPWMALSFSEGSIGGDIERISLEGLEAFYSKRGKALVSASADHEPRGSNGFAIAPSRTKGGKALLLINPHTSFFFRSEIQMTSDEGLNAYGASTWGQFFIYQGFNEKAGWMHTSSGVDVVDEFLETVVQRDGKLFYRYGGEERPVVVSEISVPYRTADGSTASRSFEVYRTHHGPIVREQDGKWVSFAMMHRPVEALSQSYLRTKAQDLQSFMKVAELKANSSNNTIFADAKGNIAYLHPQFIPRRNDRFDYTKPVDGSDPRTDWQGLHELVEAPQAVNPPNGWVMNTNNWPYSAAGPYSPKAAAYPRYMDTFGENPRGLHATMVLQNKRDFDLESLRAAAYDTYQPGFAQMIPALVDAWDRTPASNPLKRRLEGPVSALRSWDYRWGVGSIPNSLAVYWAEELMGLLPAELRAQRTRLADHLTERTTRDQKLNALNAAVQRLERDFGTWQTPWGRINRFQRLTGDIVHPFSDAGASIPVGFPSALWGSLASFGSRSYPGTKNWYGTSGNSFVAVVEFGEKVRARAVSAGGESGDPQSPHFNDQAELYATGNLRPVYFYPADLHGHVERRYRPGE